MIYQDMKIRDTKRAFIYGVALMALAGLMWTYRAEAQTLMRPGTYMAILIATAVFVPIILGTCVYYLLTTPEQNLAHIEWMASKGARLPSNFRRELFDPANAAYRLPTWRYWLGRDR